jgi:hypothetical protein
MFFKANRGINKETVKRYTQWYGGGLQGQGEGGEGGVLLAARGSAGVKQEFSAGVGVVNVRCDGSAMNGGDGGGSGGAGGGGNGGVDGDGGSDSGAGVLPPSPPLIPPKTAPPANGLLRVQDVQEEGRAPRPPAADATAADTTAADATAADATAADATSSALGVAVIVEPREHALLIPVLLNVLANLPPTWYIQVFHGSANEAFLRGSQELAPHLLPSLAEAKAKAKAKATQAEQVEAGTGGERDAAQRGGVGVVLVNGNAGAAPGHLLSLSDAQARADAANAGARGRLDRDLIARLFGGVLHPGTSGGVLDRVKGYSGLMCR